MMATTIAVQLPEQTVERLEQLAAQRRQSVDELIADALLRAYGSVEAPHSEDVPTYEYRHPWKGYLPFTPMTSPFASRRIS
jgi:hypothetical protein